MDYRKIKTITSHAGHARYLSDVGEEILGYIPTPRDIKSPYCYSATTPVLQHASGKRIFIKETSHKHYEVFELAADVVLMSEEHALAEYQRQSRLAIMAILNENNKGFSA